MMLNRRSEDIGGVIGITIYWYLMMIMENLMYI